MLTVLNYIVHLTLIPFALFAQEWSHVLFVFFCLLSDEFYLYFMNMAPCVYFISVKYTFILAVSSGQVLQFKLSDIGEGIMEVTVKEWYACFFSYYISKT